MAADAASAPPLFRFTRSAAEIAALRAVCRAWQGGPERFWSFDDVLAATQRPGALAFFAAASAGAAWDACAFADVGPFTADLLYIYVTPAARRGGLARALLSRMVAKLGTRPQLESLSLEVRAANVAAQALYERFGMRRVNTRRAYYRDGEDALVYMLELKNHA